MDSKGCLEQTRTRKLLQGDGDLAPKRESLELERQRPV